MLCIDPQSSSKIFKSAIIPHLLQPQKGICYKQTRTYWRARKMLIEAGLLEKSGSVISSGERLVINLHDSHFDSIMRRNVRRVALTIENYGPVHLHWIHKRLGYSSLRAIQNSIRTLNAAGLLKIESHEKKKMLELSDTVRLPIKNLIDEIPQAQYRAAFTDLARSLKSICHSAILLGDFAEGKSDGNQKAELLILVTIKPDGDLRGTVEKLVKIAANIKMWHGLKIHQNVVPELTFIEFLINGRGVWPSSFRKAMYGTTIVGKVPQHNGDALFEAIQKTRTFPSRKIQELLASGTLAKKGDKIVFTDLGVERYTRLIKPAIQCAITPDVTIVSPP